MATFLFKLILSPLLIGTVTLLGRRWGPAISGWLIGLPLTSGPVILFLALDQGTAFAVASARAIMPGMISVGVYCLTYSWLARRWRWLPAMLAGWLTVLASTAVLNQITVSALVGAIAVIVVLTVILRLLPDTRGAPLPATPPRWEIPLRMVIATTFVLGVTGLAQILGPHLSGLLAPFPIFATILSVFTHHGQGAAAAGKLLRGVVLGSYSFAGFFLVVAALLQSAGIGVTFLCASLVALAIQGASLWLLRRNTGDLPLPSPEP
jgi:hypothetical protein